MKKYNKTHGSPFDRGSADSYYWRPRHPHYWPEGTMRGQMVATNEMTTEEIEAYHAGYDWNESIGNKKDYG